MLRFKITKEQYEALGDAIKALYKLEGEGYMLQLDGYEDPVALKRAKDREVQLKKDAEAKARELEEKLNQIAGDDARKRGDIETLEKSWKAKLDEREAELSGKINALTGTITSSLVDNVANEIAHKISTTPKLLVPHIKARLQADFDGDTPKTRVLDAQGQPSALSIDDLAKEFSANPDFASVIVGSKASGGNAPKPTASNFDNKPQDLSKLSPSELVAYLQTKQGA